MSSSIPVAIAKACLASAFVSYLKLGDAPRQEKHATMVRVGACIDRLFDLFEESNPSAALFETQAAWDEMVEFKVHNSEARQHYKTQMTSFHNYYYETLRSDDE